VRRAQVPGDGQLQRCRSGRAPQGRWNGRRAATEQLISSLGGKVEAYYFTFGKDDFVLIADLPGNVQAAAGALAASATGAVNVHTTVLLTPEEIDAAAKQSTAYRAPGA